MSLKRDLASALSRNGSNGAPLMVRTQVDSNLVSACTSPPIEPGGTSPTASEYMNDTPSRTAMAPGPNSGGRDRPAALGSPASEEPGHGSAGVARRTVLVTPHPVV